MGMNMVSKGVQNVLDFLVNDFPDMDVIGISGECYLPLTTFKILPIKESEQLFCISWIMGSSNHATFSSLHAPAHSLVMNTSCSAKIQDLVFLFHMCDCFCGYCSLYMNDSYYNEFWCNQY